MTNSAHTLTRYYSSIVDLELSNYKAMGGERGEVTNVSRGNTLVSFYRMQDVSYMISFIPSTPVLESSTSIEENNY